MITTKINALFKFIEYLHSNIDNFNQYNGLINELELLRIEKQKVSTKKNYKDTLKWNEIQAELESKFETLQNNTANLIKAKATELNVCNFQNEPLYGWYGVETEICELKENFSKDDLPEISKCKSQYIEYRTNTHKTFLSLDLFFRELDQITKSLFDYFKETEQNEFEAFEQKTIQVNSILGVIEALTPSKIFNQLFEAALIYGTIEKPKDLFHKAALKNLHESNFNAWLQEFKNWEYGNEIQYQTHLNNETFLEYLKHENTQQIQRNREFEKEKQRQIKATEPPQQAETKTEQETIEMKPVLKPEFVQTVFDILKDFFGTEQQNQLKQVIETGDNASTKLLFKGNGNRLTDTFKKLIEHDFITGCQKQDLINWIVSNFTFTQQNKVKAFVYDTVEKTISRNHYPCKSPLIEIKNGLIQKVEQPRTKKYNKH